MKFTFAFFFIVFIDLFFFANTALSKSEPERGGKSKRFDLTTYIGRKSTVNAGSVACYSATGNQKI